MTRCTQVNRVMLMPAVSDAGEIASLFVFKGKRLPYRRALVDGMVEVQSLAQMLTRSVCLAMLEEPRRDFAKFSNWAQQLVRSIEDLAARERHVMLA